MTTPTKIPSAPSTPAATTQRTNAPILEVDSVVFGYGAETIIDNVSFDGRAGDFISIIGPSGCGKSTLLTLLDGMAQPLSGSVRVNGQKPLPGEPSRSMVFQNFALMPWKTVVDNVELGLRYRRRDLAKGERYDIAHEYLKKVGLDRSSKLYPRHLSGGMQQRVGLARAFAVQPQILLMDEPFGALDAQNAEILREDVRALVQEEQKTVVFVTHNLDEALQLSDRILLMTAGLGRIREAVSVDLPDHDDDDYPARYEAYRKQLWMHLRQEVNQTRAREEKRSYSMTTTPATRSETSPPNPTPAPPSIWTRYERYWLPIATVITILVVWEILGKMGLWNPLFFSSPSQIWDGFLSLTAGPLWSDLRVSGIEFAIGMAIALGLGVPIGLLLGTNRRLNYAFEPIVNALYSTPILVLTPLLVIWFGLGIGSKIANVAILAIFPVIINMMEGVRTVDPVLLRAARSFGAQGLSIYKDVTFPAVIPFFITGVRLAIGKGMIAVVVGEYIAATAGIGYRIRADAEVFNTSRYLAAVMIMVAISVLMMGFLKVVEKRLAPWRRHLDHLIETRVDAEIDLAPEG